MDHYHDDLPPLPSLNVLLKQLLIADNDDDTQRVVVESLLRAQYFPWRQRNRIHELVQESLLRNLFVLRSCSLGLMIKAQ